MPICKRDGFDNAPSKNKNTKDETFQDNEKVFFCEVTKEIFREYEDYFRHVMAINSTVWMCEATGRENLTYAEALKSERKARKKMELFKDSLRPPVMLVIEHAQQSSLNTLNAIVFKFLRKRFFLNEEVTAYYNSSKSRPYKVLEIIPPDAALPSSTIIYEDTDSLQYKLRRLGTEKKTEITVPFEKVRRLRHEFTSENMQMFIKDSVSRIDGILRPKPETFKKYVTNRKLSFGKLFIGKMPHYTPSKIKPRASNELTNGKKQSSMSKYLVKNGGDEKSSSGNKLSAEEQAKKEQEKIEKAEAKAKTLKEEMERVRREKQEKLAEFERQRLEKRAKLMERIENECTALLTKTDDLERTDQRLLPTFATIKTYIPLKYLGDALMVREFMHSYVGILSGIEVFRNNLSFYELSRAFTMREVAGPLSDIFLILLGTIFDLQKEEEDECTVDYLKPRYDQRQRELQITMALASRTHYYSQRHFSFKVNELPIDAHTISEVLRLHLLSSGAVVRERPEKWRVMFRNGYSSAEDPGLILRMQYPHILRALKMYTVYQLPFRDIMRLTHCLISQILTYSGTVNLIDERMEQMAKARLELRLLSTAENKRLAQVQAKRRALTCEYHLQCLDGANENDEEKKKLLEEKLNKQVAELLSQAERERKKNEQLVEKLNSSLFNFMVYLGMDRAYRKYYVFESMPGIFVEHPQDCMDTCLQEPPKNVPLSEMPTTSATVLPKNRKDLRSYLLRMYTEEEKKLLANTKTAKNKKESQENKENQENRENRLVNGNSTVEENVVTNGSTNNVGKINGDVAEAVESTTLPSPSPQTSPPPPQPTLPPTQYQLYMCTGDPNNCIVHDERNIDRQRWAYLFDKDDINALIESLNPLGERESQLRGQLTVLRLLIINHVRKCPVELFSIDDTDPNQMQRFKTSMLSETSRKYSKSNFGFPIEDADLNEVMYSSLVERILQFESDIYTGDLGRLKVKNMEKWRENVLNNAYDAQAKLQWGPAKHKQVVAGEEDEDLANEDDAIDDDEVDAGTMEGSKYSNTPYVDPGATLGDTLDIDSEDSADEGISLHDSNTLRTCVKNLASALLQVEQAIERRFLKEPFGVPVKDIKDKDLLERKIKNGVHRLKQWEVSLMESTSYSQVFLHLNILHDTIMWARSTNKSSCQVCRRGSDPDKMLLCDECNGGTHMFCMKPKMKTVPAGNWYCNRCVARLGLENDTADDHKKKIALKRKRTFIVDEEDNCSETSSVSSASANKSNGRRSNGRQSIGKRLKSNEIEEILDAADDESKIEEAEGEQDSYNENDAEDDADDNEDVEEADENTETEEYSQLDVAEEESEQEDDEMICIVCSYDGGDVTCSHCRDSFHLECIDLKRPPRYNFVCNKCKTKEDKKRRNQLNDDSTDEDSDDGSQEPIKKRSRQSRASLRNSLPNGIAAEDISSKATNNSRRSNRRTAEHLPLNSSALYELLEDIMKHEHAWPFLRPVSQSEVPDYYKIIKNPMDFAKVKSKLNMGAYQLNEEVLKDIQLIFRNCDTYNVEGNEIYEVGASLEKFVIERSNELNLPFTPSDMNA